MRKYAQGKQWIQKCYEENEVLVTMLPMPLRDYMAAISSKL